MKLSYFFLIFNSFLIFSTNFCPKVEISGLKQKLDGQIWVQPKDSKPISISGEIAQISEFLNNYLKQHHDENTKINPVKLPQILEIQFNTFQSMKNILLAAYNAQKINDTKSVEQQFNIALEILAKLSDKNIINHLFKVANLLDIPILKEFIYKNIAKLCMINSNCLDILIKNLDGSIIEFSGNDEINFKKELLANNNFSNLENFHIKKQKKLEQDKYKTFIENRQVASHEIMLTDNIKISTRADQKYLFNGTVSFFKKDGTYLGFKSIGYNAPVETLTLNPNKTIIAIAQNGLIQFFKVPTINDSNISEMLKIDGTNTLVEDNENFSYIKIEYKPKLIAFNNNGTKLGVVGELYKDNKKEIKLFIYKNINGKWQQIKEAPIEEGNGVELLSLQWNNETESLTITFIESQTINIYEIFPNIFKTNEQIANLSINKIILLLVLSELNKSPEGQSKKNRELIINSLKNFVENI